MVAIIAAIEIFMLIFLFFQVQRHAFQFFCPRYFRDLFQDRQLNSHKSHKKVCVKNTEATIKGTNCDLNWASKVLILIPYKKCQNGNEECDKSGTTVTGEENDRRNFKQGVGNPFFFFGRKLISFPVEHWLDCFDSR